MWKMRLGVGMCVWRGRLGDGRCGCVWDLLRGYWAVYGCVECGVEDVGGRVWRGRLGLGGQGVGVYVVHVGMCDVCDACECVCYTFLFLTVKSLIKIGFGSLKTEWMHFTACLARSGEPF